MDEEISIINSNTRAENIKNFLKSNKKIIIIILSVIIVFLFTFFIFKDLKEKDKINLSNDYNEALTSFNEGNTERTINILNNIILEEDSTYSPLALYFLIDKKLITSKNQINKKFNQIIEELDLEDEIKFLVIYKKALYNADTATENELIEILSPITNSESIWKSHSLYLLAEFFMSKNEKQKAEEFYKMILTLEKSNKKIKTLTEKRIQNEFSKK